MVWPMPPLNFSHASQDFLTERVSECTNEAKFDILRVQNVLVETIRLEADSNKTVGKDCMAVLIQNPNAPYAHAQYEAYDEQPIVLESWNPEHQPIVHAAAYSPWIVGPSHVYSASVIAGRSPAFLGDFTVDRSGPELNLGEGEGLAFMDGQPRKPFP